MANDPADQVTSRVLVVEGEKVDLIIAGDDEVTPEMVLEQITSPTTTIFMTKLPPSVKTFGDFFDNGDVGRALAQKMADEIFGPDRDDETKK